jgi:hypothetical protein
MPAAKIGCPPPLLSPQRTVTSFSENSRAARNG